MATTATITGDRWIRVSRRDPRVVGLYSRHYSAKKNNKTTRDWLAYGITAPGETLVYVAPDCSALFVWIKEKYRYDHQEGVNCAVFRNEGSERSSDLILEAEQIAFQKWGSVRLFTYVDPKEITSSNPGYCFKVAGWELVRDERGKPVKTQDGLILLEKLPKR